MQVLARHYRVEDNELLRQIIEGDAFDDEEADLNVLFNIAKVLDDGHGLKGYKTEAAWHCSRARLFEFGGCGEFVGARFSVSGAANEVTRLGEDIEEALEKGDTNQCAQIVKSEIDTLLDGIFDGETRAEVSKKLLAILADDNALRQPG